MKYIAKGINIFTNKTIEEWQFDTIEEAVEYAFTMNEAMAATPIRYKVEMPN